ncbi:MBL fold metallo-hydrolase [Candidatus Micrarchaeota archaeon]|nr:MBL fold metallo-hydrolase [Candidatus Micrarchaeota archaeon]
MSSITCYGGVGEIGGNKVLVEDSGTRIFLDFGQSFTHLDDYFVEYLQPRLRFGLRDYFALDLMPKLKGLYNSWAVDKTDIDHCGPQYHAVFLSHPHYDHIAHIRYLDQRIPIYMGETARTILRSVNDTGRAQWFYEKDGVARDGSVIPANDVRIFRTGESIDTGSIEVLPVHVDHSVPGAYGFVVNTGSGAVAYTGDIRRHGNRPEMTRDFIDRAKQAGPKVLVVEGTRVAPEEKRKDFSEAEVHEKGKEIVESNGFVMAMRYPKDLDRFRTFYQIAKETGRKLVISLKTAHMLQALREDKALALPQPFEDSSLEVYKREMKVYKVWEVPMLDKCVDYKWVKQNQDSIIWEQDFYTLTELIDVKPGKGACIHSMSEPFEEDPMSQLQDEILQNWLGRFGIGHHQLHASGHASMDEIFEIVEEIGADKVVPVHTQHPELFTMENAVKTEAGKPIEV